MILNKIKNTVGTITNNILNNVVSPMDRLEYHLENKQAELKEVMNNITKLHTEISKLKKSQKTIESDIDEAVKSAKHALSTENEELAKKILERKVSLESSKERNEAFINELNGKEAALKNQSLIFKQSIEDIKSQINVLKMDNSIADVKLSVAEHTSTLNDDSFEINKQFERAEDIIDDKSSRADAILDLEEDGAYDVLTNKDDVGDAIKKTSIDAKVSDELAKLKEDMQ